MDWRVTLKMAQDGRKSRNQHTMVFRVAPTGNFDQNAARNFAEDLAGAFAGVMFANTFFLRVRFVALDSKDNAVPYSGFGQPLNLVGRNAFAADDGPANSHVVLNIEKSASGGDPAISRLRHCLSALEFAAYELDADIPARFSAAPVGSWGAGASLSVNIKKAFTDNNFQMKLKPIKVDGQLVSRVVTELETQDFSLVSNTKQRISVEAATAAAAQREINAMRRRAWSLWEKVSESDAPAIVLAAIRDLIAQALLRYNALPPAVRILVKLMDFPNVPALPAP